MPLWMLAIGMIGPVGMFCVAVAAIVTHIRRR